MKKLLGRFGLGGHIRGMETPYHDRSKVCSTLTTGWGGKLTSGIFAANSHKVMPVESCLLQDEVLDKTMLAVRAAAGTAFGTPEDIALTLEQKKDWYGLDMQFFSENPGFEPLRVLAGAGNFPNEYLPYYGPDALAAQMKNIVEYYRTGAAPQGHTYRWLTKEGMDTFIRRNACEIRPLLQGL